MGGVFLWCRIVKITGVATRCHILKLQEAQLSPSDRAMRLVSSNLAGCHATVQKLFIAYDRS